MSPLGRASILAFSLLWAGAVGRADEPPKPPAAHSAKKHKPAKPPAKQTDDGLKKLMPIKSFGGY